MSFPVRLLCYAGGAVATLEANAKKIPDLQAANAAAQASSQEAQKAAADASAALASGISQVAADAKAVASQGVKRHIFFE